MLRTKKPDWKPCEEFQREKEEAEERDGNFEALERDSESHSKRPKNLAQANKSELAAVKANLKSMLPTLASVEIRRSRRPFYETVILELEEDGLLDAAQYMKMLLALDVEMRNKAGPGTIIWEKPQLKYQKQVVDELRTGLKKANEAKIAGKLIAQATTLLETALLFQRAAWEWWWIAEQLFRSALTVSEALKEDDNQLFTMIRYLYGRFLLNEMKNPQEALDYLNDARELSRNKWWTASRILGTKQENLFRESCALLYRALLILAKQVREENPELAVTACANALKRAKDAAHDEFIAETLCELGKSYLCAGQTKQALQRFAKYLTITTRIQDYEGICNAHMELAFAYKTVEDEENTVKHLQLFRERASQFQLPYKLAQAHYHTGEHSLHQGHPDLATPHLEFAFTLYNSLGQTVESDKARSVAAVSKGQEVIDRMIELLLKCGKYDQSATLKICHWKNNRLPFWTMGQEDDHSGEAGESIGERSGEESVGTSFLSVSSGAKIQSESHSHDQ